MEGYLSLSLKSFILNRRFLTLDVFRGATVALMILVNNPGSWSYIYSPLEHANWHGCTPTDLVFPFFLFAVGNSLAFGMPKLKSGTAAGFMKKVFLRAALIFLIGLLLNWSPFVRWDDGNLVLKTWQNLRVFGVLQRIALAYLLASLLIYLVNQRQLIISLVILLTGYWLATLFLGTQNSPYSLEGFWGTPIDRTLLGNHIYKGEGVPFDPEGLVSTLGSIGEVIIGYLCGRFILLKGADYPSITRLFTAGTLLTFAGFCTDLVFPINKKIWSSSFVLYTSGIAILIIALLLFLLEIKDRKGALSKFCEVFGKNPLFIFVLSGLLPRTLGLIRIPVQTANGSTGHETPFAWFFHHVCEPLFKSPYNSSLFYAICMVAFYWLIGSILDRKKIYIKV